MVGTDMPSEAGVSNAEGVGSPPSTGPTSAPAAHASPHPAPPPPPPRIAWRALDAMVLDYLFQEGRIEVGATTRCHAPKPARPRR